MLKKNFWIAVTLISLSPALCFADEAEYLKTSTKLMYTASYTFDAAFAAIKIAAGLYNLGGGKSVGMKTSGSLLAANGITDGLATGANLSTIWFDGKIPQNQ